MYKSIFSRLTFVNKLKLYVFSDLVFLTITTYFLAKKTFSFSLTGWLADNWFQISLVNSFVSLSIWVIVAAIAIKIVSIILNEFPVDDSVTVEPDQISHCLQVINNEISLHLSKLNNDKPILRNLNEQHRFDVNIRMIVDALAEHIRSSVKIKLKKKDIFISLYSFNEKINSLSYELHYDPKRDSVSSRVIPLEGKGSGSYRNYECVKCLRSSASTIYALNKSTYQKCTPKRYKTLNQYMGCKLESNGNVLGFLNIEFHNYQVFNGEDKMRDFMEDNIFPFKLLLEYQYLKQSFFKSFVDLEENWEINDGQVTNQNQIKI